MRIEDIKNGMIFKESIMTKECNVDESDILQIDTHDLFVNKAFLTLQPYYSPGSNSLITFFNI